MSKTENRIQSNIWRLYNIFGNDYYNISDTNSCIRISGYLSSVITAGNNVYLAEKSGLRNDSYTWLFCATLRFHTAPETEPECLKTYVKLWSEKYDGSKFSSTNVRYGDIPSSGLRVGVDEQIFTSCSGCASYVYSGNVNAASSRSISRAKPNDNLMVGAYKPW